MATVSMPRQPFGVLDSPRLAHLSGIKNRQNGMIKTPSPLSGKAKMLVPTSSPSLKPSAKRRVTPSFDDFDGQNDDAENVNPNMFLSPMKRTKLDLPSTSLKPKGLSTLPSSFNFTFNPTKTTPTTSMPPPATVPSRLSTPMKYAGVTKPSARTPSTAPAGRSPKSKRDKGRRLSAHTPITRIDSSLLSRSSARTGLPFSIDAALTASLKSTAPAAVPLPKPASSIEESMPSSWFFAIHEDTADEEAENLMEHSTLTLDLSSDDESAAKANEDRGKENVAPADYDPVASSSSSPRSSRRSLKSAADMETDEAARAPLGSLDTTEFIPEGLTKDSIVVINELPETCTLESPIEKQKLECNPPIVISPPKKTCIADLKDDIFIFEDESASPALSTGGKRKRSADDDEDE
ncbi:hypothetical protein M436DRAFT_80254 [Aureobasidium namibiae CBS 147.97]|uniref:Thymidylate kinase n=1 Tax=Aureobasidium namibiae CBS 147.97 TaxID=1043004 RepID=A0A074WTA5_9PEZI